MLKNFIVLEKQELELLKRNLCPSLRHQLKQESDITKSILLNGSIIGDTISLFAIL